MAILMLGSTPTPLLLMRERPGGRRMGEDQRPHRALGVGVRGSLHDVGNGWLCSSRSKPIG